MENKIEEMLSFPVIYTFKIVGNNSSEFINDVEDIVNKKQILDKTINLSSSGKYISFGITIEIESYEELKGYYVLIKGVKGLRYYL
ncbi:MAG: DUF493 domain-containing protein [Calditerrivibrio sp.]|nr:DUF493 domain-containing protein [Calditerrivibrio sp.]MCA1933153.1 DUF493 domain-containing protein [Calditerrivibrio sp.]MCA1980686.1 DUF493 domain-containing protein [Calditerrivibrio sp.]